MVRVDQKEELENLRKQHELLKKMLEQQEQLRALQGRQEALMAMQESAEQALAVIEDTGENHLNSLCGPLIVKCQQVIFEEKFIFIGIASARTAASQPFNFKSYITEYNGQ